MIRCIRNAAVKAKLNHHRRKKDLEEKGLLPYVMNSRGYVLIIVLIITSLLFSLMGEFISVSQTNVRYIRKFDRRIKASYIARSGFMLARYILEADSRGLGAGLIPGTNTDKNTDTYKDIWAIDFPELPVEEGTLKLRIIDENSKINLSVLANEVVDKTPYYGIVQRFFLNMGLPMDYADVIIDWVDIDDSRFPYGAESSDYYLTLTPAYNAKNSSMDSIDELLMLRGFTPEIYYGLSGGNTGLEENIVDHNRGQTTFSAEKIFEMVQARELPTEDEMLTSEIKIGKEKTRSLKEYFRVYGDRKNYLNELNKININTAPFRVISALTDNMTDDRVSEIISRRLSQPFKSTDELKDYIEDETVRKNILTVKSSIFTIISEATIGETSLSIVATYNRSYKKIYYWSED